MVQNSIFVAGRTDEHTEVVSRTATLKAIYVVVPVTGTMLWVYPGTQELATEAAVYDAGGFVIEARQAVEVIDLNNRFNGGISVHATGSTARYLMVYS